MLLSNKYFIQTLVEKCVDYYQKDREGIWEEMTQGDSVQK